MKLRELDAGRLDESFLSRIGEKLFGKKEAEAAEPRDSRLTPQEDLVWKRSKAVVLKFVDLGKLSIHDEKRSGLVGRELVVRYRSAASGPNVVVAARPDWKTRTELAELLAGREVEELGREASAEWGEWLREGGTFCSFPRVAAVEGAKNDALRRWSETGEWLCSLAKTAAKVVREEGAGWDVSSWFDRQTRQFVLAFETDQVTSTIIGKLGLDRAAPWNVSGPALDPIVKAARDAAKAEKKEPVRPAAKAARPEPARSVREAAERVADQVYEATKNQRLALDVWNALEGLEGPPVRPAPSQETVAWVLRQVGKTSAPLGAALASLAERVYSTMKDDIEAEEVVVTVGRHAPPSLVIELAGLLKKQKSTEKKREETADEEEEDGSRARADEKAPTADPASVGPADIAEAAKEIAAAVLNPRARSKVVEVIKNAPKSAVAPQIPPAVFDGVVEKAVEEEKLDASAEKRLKELAKSLDGKGDLEDVVAAIFVVAQHLKKLSEAREDAEGAVQS